MRTTRTKTGKVRSILFAIVMDGTSQLVYAVETTNKSILETSSGFTNQITDWHKSITRSSPSIPTVSIKDATLIIENPSCNCDITISITDNEGYSMFEATIPAANTGYIPVSLEGYPSGNYTLTLRNPSGGYLYGYFTISE